MFAIQVPPLRDRRDDVRAAGRHFLAARGLPPSKLGRRGARPAHGAHAWPGNVRELENALERALILAGEREIRAQDLSTPATLRARSRVADVLVDGFDLDAFERELILAAIERAGGNKAAAARLLGITRRRLYSRLEALGRKEEGEEGGGS